jgi:hypothetical protein
MRRRDFSKALIVSPAGARVLSAPIAPDSRTHYEPTRVEIETGVEPVDFSVPSHATAGEVFPQRYGARFDGRSDDTAAHSSAWTISLATQCPVVNPGGVTMVRNLKFGTNDAGGHSRYPPGMRGGGVFTIFRAIPGTTGTVISARGASGMYLRDFVVDCNHTAAIAIDTSWGIVGPSVQNTYENVWVQNFTESGWLGLNDNQSKYKDIVARGATTTLILAGPVNRFDVGETVIGESSGASGAVRFRDLASRRLHVSATSGLFWDSESVRGTRSRTRAVAVLARNASALSGIRVEGSGGSIFLDNVTAADSFLSICCQNAEIHGGFSFGIRLNESQTGLNLISFSGGTQIYCNPTTNSHFEDSNSGLPGHYATAIAARGLYIISAPGDHAANVVNCGVLAKVSFQECAFVRMPGASGPWRVYGPRARCASETHPAIISFDGCDTGALEFNTAERFATVRKDVASGGAWISDFPMRVVFRKTLDLPADLPAGAFIPLIPAAAMTEPQTCYLLAISVSGPGSANLCLLAGIGSTSKDGPTPPSAPFHAPPCATTTNERPPEVQLRYSAASRLGEQWHSGIEVALNWPLALGARICGTLIRAANPTSTY